MAPVRKRARTTTLSYKRSYYRRRRTFGRRRVYRRRRSLAANGRRTVGPFRRSLDTTFVYSTGPQTSLTAAGVGWNHVTFRMNSMYDPEFTGTGHQPQYYDTFLGANLTTAPYGRYVVKGARITATFRTYNGTYPSTPMQVGIYVRRKNQPDISALLTAGQKLKEIPGCKSRQILGINSDKEHVTVSFYVNMARFFQVRSIDAREAVELAYNSTEPTNQIDNCYADVFALADSLTASDFTRQVTIKYYVRLKDRNAVAQS